VIIAVCSLTAVGIPLLTVMGLGAAASVTVALLIAVRCWAYTRGP
jgi:uncharacterized membrane protein YdfJ with MMPL/SSD domain